MPRCYGARSPTKTRHYRWSSCPSTTATTTTRPSAARRCLPTTGCGAIRQSSDRTLVPHSRPLPPSDASGTRLWAVAVVAGLIGSALSLGVVAVAGRLSSDVVEKPVVERVAVRPVAELSLASSSGRGVIAIAKSVAPAIARVESIADQGKTIASAILVRTDGYLATNAHVVAHITQRAGRAVRRHRTRRSRCRNRRDDRHRHPEDRS